MCNVDVCKDCSHYEPQDADNKQETIERLKRQVKQLSDENVNLQTKVKHLNQMGSIFRLDRNENVVIVKGLSDENIHKKLKQYIDRIMPGFRLISLRDDEEIYAIGDQDLTLIGIKEIKPGFHPNDVTKPNMKYNENKPEKLPVKEAQ